MYLAEYQLGLPHTPESEDYPGFRTFLYHVEYLQWKNNAYNAWDLKQDLDFFFLPCNLLFIFIVRHAAGWEH